MDLIFYSSLEQDLIKAKPCYNLVIVMDPKTIRGSCVLSYLQVGHVVCVCFLNFGCSVSILYHGCDTSCIYAPALLCREIRICH